MALAPDTYSALSEPMLDLQQASRQWASQDCPFPEAGNDSPGHWQAALENLPYCLPRELRRQKLFSAANSSTARSNTTPARTARLRSRSEQTPVGRSID